MGMLMDTNQRNSTHDPARRSWVESANAADSDFPIQNLPFGAFSTRGSARIGVAIGAAIVDLDAALAAGLLTGHAAAAVRACAGGRLNGLMALGPGAASALRAQLSDLLRFDSSSRGKTAEVLVQMGDVRLLLPCDIGDFSDFLTSLHHTERHGRYKGLADPLPAAFKSLPIAYHGRASSICVSGAEVVRPRGQFKDASGAVRYGPATMLDFELELGAFVGRGNALSETIRIDEARQHIFGYCLLNDWSAKSIQWWEQVLGPFLGKSFMTTISPWIVTEEALLPFRMPAPQRGADAPALLPHLHGARDREEGGIDISLEARISSARQRSAGQQPTLITRTHLNNLYWTFGQMLAHHASNGCNLRPGDLLGSGTISGADDLARACITELTNAGRDPLALGNGELRTALEDGDEIVFRARAERAGFVAIGFGECRGRIVPAREEAA